MYGISKVMVSVERKKEKSSAYTLQGVQMFGRHLLCIYTYDCILHLLIKEKKNEEERISRF